MAGFNVVQFDNQNNKTQLNTALIQCGQCVTCLGHSYSFFVPKHRSGHGIFIEMVKTNGQVLTFGPAVKL